MASTSLNQFLFLRSFSSSSSAHFLSFLFLSIWDAYKWSAKLPRELLLLVHVFQRMGKKDSLACSFVRSLSVLACTHGYHNHNLLVYRCIIAPMCLFVDGCWDFSSSLSLSCALAPCVSLDFSCSVSFTLFIDVCIVFTWGKREKTREEIHALTVINSNHRECVIVQDKTWIQRADIHFGKTSERRYLIINRIIREYYLLNISSRYPL